MKLDFTGASVLVVGDIILDQYYYGKVTRISPEAPVPVVKVERSSWNLGGAGNASSNIAHLGAESILIGLAGNDESRTILENLLIRDKIIYELIDSPGPTTSKIRVIGEHQQMMRLDFEKVQGINEESYDKLKNNVLNRMVSSNVIVLSDYGKGILSNDLCSCIIKNANKMNKITIVDPKGNDWSKYSNATIITPNVNELSEAAGRLIRNNDDEIVGYGRELLKKYRLKYILVTRSDKGMSLIGPDRVNHIPTDAIEVSDVSGAGDTVVATLAVCISKGMEWTDSIKIANRAAGIVVSKAGTVPVSLDELEDSYEDKESAKILTREKVILQINKLRSAGKTVVFTNGCFDILHAGHVNYLRKAKNLGDILVVGLNSDNSVKRLKGKNRPVNKEADRAEILSCLEFVDFITVFDEDTPFELLKSVRPDFLVKGGDYKAEEVIGREFAGETVILQYVKGYSTTEIIKKKDLG